MDKLSKDTLILLALELNISDVLSLCRTKKMINEKVCENRNFWRQKLEIDFPGRKYDESINPKDIYMIYHQSKDIKLPESGGGLKMPVFIKYPLKKFLLDTNYGPHDAEIKTIIKPLLAQDVMARYIIGSLFGFWAKQNRFTVLEDGRERTYLRADDAMRSNLGPYLKQVVTKFPKFDPNKFKFARFQNIISPGITRNNQLSSEQLEYTKDPYVKRIIIYTGDKINHFRKLLLKQNVNR